MSASNVITFKLIIDGKEATATLDTTDQDLKKIVGSSKDVTDSMAKWGMIVTGFNQSLQLAQQAVHVFEEAVVGAAAETAMRDNFQGTTQDIESLRNAVKGTVDEGDLIGLSNQATALNVPFKDQPLVFAIAERAINKFGGTVQENFQRMVFASEGILRALKSVGISGKDVAKYQEEMAKARGSSFAQLDVETQKEIYWQAVIKASKMSAADLTEVMLNEREVYAKLGASVEDSKKKFGEFINTALVPMIQTLTSSGDASKVVVGGLVSITSFVVPLIPIITQFKTAQKLLELQAIDTSAALDVEAFSAKGLLASLGIIAAVATIVWAGWEMRKAQIEKARKDAEDFAAKNGNLLVHSKEYIPAVTNATSKNTVADIEAKIKQLQTTRENMVAGSKELLNLDKEIAKLQNSIKPPDPKTDKKADAANNIGQEITKTIELKGELEKIKILKDESISQFEQDKLIAQQDFDTKIKGYDAEIAALQKKKKLSEDDLTKIDNLNLQKLTAQGNLDLKIKSLTEKNYDDIKNFTDQLDKEALDQTKEINQAKIDALADSTAKEKAIKDHAANDEWLRQQKLLDIYRDNAVYRAAIDQQYANKSKKINDSLNIDKLDAISKSAALIQGIFGKQTAAYKTLAIAQTSIETYKAAAAALAPPPVGAGPLFGPILAAATIAAGLANVAQIASTNVSMPGYARGGIVVGENGPEIIAPMDSYAQGQTQLILSTMATLKNEMRSGNYTGNYIPDNTSLIAEIRGMNSKLENLASRPSIAYLNDREANKIYYKGNSNNRRSKL